MDNLFLVKKVTVLSDSACGEEAIEKKIEKKW
jgi:hypothetical protein